MKIFFGCTSAKLFEYKDYYFAIRDFLIKEGHVLTRDWLPITLQRAVDKKKLYDPKSVYGHVMAAINKSDLIIVENTVAGFSTGHYITIGMQRRKPVLVLRLDDRKSVFRTTLLEGVDNEYVEIVDYNLGNYKEKIRAFIKKYEKSTQKHRFHLVIDDVERRYLEWARVHQGKSRTKIIRDSLRETIKQDEKYEEYLRNP